MSTAISQKGWLQQTGSFLPRLWRQMATGLGFTIFGLGGLCLSLTWFPALNLFVWRREVRIRWARSTIGACFKLFLKFIRLIGIVDFDQGAISGLAHVGKGLVVANHPTLIDYVFICSENPQIDCLVKKQLFSNFFLKGVVKAADYLPNDASDVLLRECLNRIKAGRSILIFPEGTRTVPGKPMKLHRGVAHIALRASCAVQLIHIRCSEPWLFKNHPWYKVPERRPYVQLRKGAVVNAADFLREGEDCYSLASRRLTGFLKAELSE